MPILKFIPEDVVSAVVERVGAESGDLVFFKADSAKVVNDAMGALRELGGSLNLLAANSGHVGCGLANVFRGS